MPVPCRVPYTVCHALCQCPVLCHCLCQAKLIAGLRANSQKSRANKLLRNADGAGFSAAAAAAAMGQAAAPDGRSALIGALRSMTAAAAGAEKPAAAATASTTAPAYTAEVATLAQSAAVAAPVAPDDSPKGDRQQETAAPRKKVPSLIVPALKLTKGQASRRAMRPGRED